MLNEIRRVNAGNYGVYGARKVWLALNREGIAVARCAVERLMREDGLAGAVRGKVRRTTIADPAGPRARDLVRRDFASLAPDRLWVADITYASTWSGWVYVAFVIDAFTRRIIGWRCGSSMSTQLVLDALEQAVWTREREGRSLESVVAHKDRWSQYAAIRYNERLAEANISASVGSVGSSYDNALAESINGLYKTELIKPRGPWRALDLVEYVTAEWVDWLNHRRLYEYCGEIPPVDLETAHYAQARAQHGLELSNHESPAPPGRFNRRTAARNVDGFRAHNRVAAVPADVEQSAGVHPRGVGMHRVDEGPPQIIVVPAIEIGVPSAERVNRARRAARRLTIPASGPHLRPRRPCAYP